MEKENIEYENVTEAKGDICTEDEERGEYEELIRTKYKKFYNEDAQKMINKRFRKYKELEERLEKYENEKRLSDESFAAEKEKIIKETEQRLIKSFKERWERPAENGILSFGGYEKRNPSSLTKSERAEIALRVSRGEIIKI